MSKRTLFLLMLIGAYSFLFSQPCLVEGQVRYAGIELGAKGIKVSVIEIKSERLSVLKIDKEAFNTNLAEIKDRKFGTLKIEDVAFVVHRLKNWLNNQLDVPATNIRVVASSGVPSFATDFKMLVAAIQTKSELQLEKISAEEEAWLTNLALIPIEDRTTAIVVDVGSGNTKGGAFVKGTGAFDDFVPVRVQFGTVSLAQRIKEQAKDSGEDPRAIARQIAQEEIGASLLRQVKSNPVLGERTKVLIAGGSVWAMTTLMKPETALDSFPAITAADISMYKSRLELYQPVYPRVDFTKIRNTEARKLARTHFNMITGASRKAIFTPDELLAGAILLEKVSEVLDFKNRQVMFDRKSLTAWITAKITPEKYLEQLPRALGRELPQELSEKKQAAQLFDNTEQWMGCFAGGRSSLVR